MSTISDLFGCLTFNSNDQAPLKIGVDVTITLESEQFIKFTKTYKIAENIQRFPDEKLVPHLAMHLTFQHVKKPFERVEKAEFIIYAEADHKTPLQTHAANDNGEAFVFFKKSQFAEGKENAFFIDVADLTLKFHKFSQTFTVPKDSQKFEKTFEMARVYYVAVYAQDGGKGVKDITVMGTKDTTPLFGGKTRDDGLFMTNVTGETRTVTVVISDPSGKYNGDFRTETVPEDQYLYYFNFSLKAKVELQITVVDQQQKPIQYHNVNISRNGAIIATEFSDFNGIIKFPNKRGQVVNIGDVLLLEVKFDLVYKDFSKTITINSNKQQEQIQLELQQNMTLKFKLSTAGSKCISEAEVHVYNASHWPLFNGKTVECQIQFNATPNEQLLQIGQDLIYVVNAYQYQFIVLDRLNFKKNDEVVEINMIPDPNLVIVKFHI